MMDLIISVKTKEQCSIKMNKHVREYERDNT